METSHTSRTTRIIIWVIAIVMAVGSVGAYFIIIFQNDDQTSASKTQATQSKQSQKADPTAYKVEGKVNELQITDLKEGAGAEVKLGDTIRVHYKLTTAKEGNLIESSYNQGEPATFKLEEGGLIEGWTKGVPGMKEGGKRRLVIPSAMAYGEQGSGATIAPNTDLVFEVEVLAVNPTGTTQ